MDVLPLPRLVPRGLRALLLLHISGGAVALLTGPFQFWERLRRNSRRLHRALGRAYVIAIAVSAPGALPFAYHSL